MKAKAKPKKLPQAAQKVATYLESLRANHPVESEQYAVADFLLENLQDYPAAEQPAAAVRMAQILLTQAQEVHTELSRLKGP